MQNRSEYLPEKDLFDLAQAAHAATVKFKARTFTNVVDAVCVRELFRAARALYGQLPEMERPRREPLSADKFKALSELIAFSSDGTRRYQAQIELQHLIEWANAPKKDDP